MRVVSPMSLTAFVLLLALAPAPPGAAPVVTVTVHPEAPWLEPHPAGTQLNCDFVVRNVGAEPLTLDELQVSVLDPTGKLLARKFLSTNGTRASIDTVGTREVAPGSFIVIFNPFYDWAEGFLPNRMRYELTFHGRQKDAPPVKAEVSFTPRIWVQHAELFLPVKGRLLVWDGHDYYSHHRRWDVGHPVLQRMGIVNNPARYSYDLSVVNEAGDLFRGTGATPEEWYGFGAPIYAPAAGTVVEATNTFADHGPNKLDVSQIEKNPKIIGGNYVLIDHGQGEWSALYHMKQGSVTVKPGDRVSRGQHIGAMGMSGDAFTVHLHYQLQAGPGFDVEGLPSLFSGYRRVLGARTVPVARGVVDTGDFLLVE